MDLAPQVSDQSESDLILTPSHPISLHRLKSGPSGVDLDHASATI
jgi:hypothetical protein